MRLRGLFWRARPDWFTAMRGDCTPRLHPKRGPGGRYNPRMPRALLRSAAAARFLSRNWHKRPLLIRQALPGFRDILSWTELSALAMRDDVESRLVMRERSRWTL